MPIKTIAIFPNVSKPQAPEVLRRILQFYQDKDVQLMLPVDESRYFDLLPSVKYRRKLMKHIF